ncbi:MAG: alpha/beta hydrolase [Actinomycetota bacterium]|jgi:pimeloyl-ACP methyl ester carboxylesterase|nr:alpha/beta hydrolase [Actinomycetota bacterium]
MGHHLALAVDDHRPARPSPGLPLVVLVHGSLDRAASFARVIRRLGDLPVVAYDRRGYHRSRTAGPVATTLAEHVDDLLDVLDGRPAVVVGHSYGGVIALAAAAGGAGAIVGVGAYEPPLPWLDRLLDPGSPPRTPLAGDPALVAESFFRHLVGNDTWERLPPATRQARRAEGPALVGELSAIRSGHPAFDVASVTVPVLVGRGGRSLERHRQGAAWLADHLPDGELVDIEGAAHGAHLTHPDAFAALVRRAVDRALPATRTDKTCASS